MADMGRLVCCPRCGREVKVRPLTGIRAADRGRIVEHFRPRVGPIPLGCDASGKTPEQASALGPAPPLARSDQPTPRGQFDG